jgi:crooked neck
MRKRKEFEDSVRRNRLNIGAWIKYARWEASQKEFDRYAVVLLRRALAFSDITF